MTKVTKVVKLKKQLHSTLPLLFSTPKCNRKNKALSKTTSPRAEESTVASTRPETSGGRQGRWRGLHRAWSCRPGHTARPNRQGRARLPRSRFWCKRRYIVP